jgi:enoyl-CoA hydratase/carnithine racemase
MSGVLLREKRGQALWLTINRPERRNAMTEEVVIGIADGLHAAHADPEVRAVVLTGVGEAAFCAGADLTPGRNFEFDFSRPSTRYADLLRQASRATLPLVARVNGACMAGGMGLLAMCDLAIAADTAKFGLPEVKVGLFPMQVLSVLRTVIPQRTLAEWCLTGETFDASDALTAGLVNYVVPAIELDAKVEWLLARIVDKSPTAIRRGKYAMRAVAAMSLEESISYTESQIGTLVMTEDSKEGRAAFAEKRKPSWTGR